MFKYAVDPKLLLLIERLSKVAEVRSRFYLAGGTGLALQFGHRRSDDLDFFSATPFDVERIARTVIELDGRILAQEEGTIHCIIDGVKVSFLFYPYPVLYPFQSVEGFGMASVGDIACMKAIAISQRGEKKDFFDMVEILRRHEPRQIKEMFMKKYGSRRVNCYHILKSLFYFADAEDSPDPVSLNNSTWPSVKDFLLKREKDLMRELCLTS